MSFFKPTTVKYPVAGATLNLRIVPAKDFGRVVDLQAKFNELTDTDGETFDGMITEIAELIVEYCSSENSEGPTVDDIKELPVSEIGKIFGKLASMSNDPKGK
jgi:hypothetical protein